MFLTNLEKIELENRLTLLIKEKQILKIDFKSKIISKKIFKKKDVLLHNEIRDIKIKLDENNYLFDMLNDIKTRKIKLI